MDLDKPSIHMKPVKLKQWLFVWGSGRIPGIASAETCAALPAFSLCGVRERDNQKVVTTAVMARLESRLLRTKSGTIYELVGPPDPDYAALCIANKRSPLREDLQFPTDRGGDRS